MLSIQRPADKAFDICIRGAGIVGRCLALHLASKQLRVALIAAPAPANTASGASDVRAYALNQRSRQLLEAVRCWPEAQHATPVLSMQVHGDGGGEVAFDATQTDSDALNWIVDVPALETRLTQAVGYQPLIEVMDSPPPATLTVVCEGRTSATRTQWGVQWDVTPYHQWALATRIHCTLPHQQTAHQWFDRGEILAFLPLDGMQGHTHAVVWSLPPEKAQALQSTSPDEFCNALEVASHSSLGKITLAGERKTWVLQKALTKRWVGMSAQGAWALAGDSAHNMHPLAGQGLNMGLADVAELIRVLEHRPTWRSVADPKLLRQYERARRADFAVLGEANDVLQQIFTNPSPTALALRNWGMNQFQNSGPIKQWVARRAMGVAGQGQTQGSNRP